MASFGTPDTVIAQMVVTPADSMTWLSTDSVSGWVQVMYPDNAAPQEGITQPSTTRTSMTCRSTATGNIYSVDWSEREAIWVGKRQYTVAEYHEATKEIGAMVVSGKTHIKTDYAAVFGGPSPRMSYSDGKDVAVDQCW